ncbi:ABC transporter transmembrane domain-containing protein [Glaciecola sp. 1036]|uniref:ABC transporter transmembrane domain-containing protein n=1 Tax=Alteromonadaceae TaxID=72275 RepID=UPI003D03A79C
MSEPQKDVSVVRWLAGFLSPYKRQVLFAVIALGISASTWLVLGQGIKYVVDNGFANNDLNVINQAFIAVLVIVIIGSFATFVRFYYMVWLGERVSADIRKSLFNHLITLSPSFYEQERTGEIISRFTSDTTLLQSVVGTGISMALRSAVTFIGALVLMLFTSPMLTLYVFLAIPLILIPVKIIGPKVREFSKDSQDKVAEMGSLVDENLHEIKTVQAFNAQSQAKTRFADQVNLVMQSASGRIKYRALLITTVMIVSMCAIVFVAWIGMRAVLADEISSGQLIAFMFYAVMAGGGIATISEVIGEIQKAAGASERIIQLLSQESHIKSSGNKTLESISDPILALENISFAYEEENVIRQLSCEINYGQKVAFVGPSGAGKSTLFDLILRFYDISQGQIKLNGKPHSDYSLHDLRSQFAFVSQDPVIFAGSVAENISFGDPTLDREDIINAAKLAFADDFIQELPLQYDSQLGERGVKLSGGQKQRIAIARAIAANRPILLLDEATSALDAKSEKVIKQALDSLMKEKTTLIIAHRLSTVANADKIYVMDKGKIIASGVHKDLYQTNPEYKEFVDLQMVVE